MLLEHMDIQLQKKKKKDESWHRAFAVQSLWWKGHPFPVLVLEGVVGLHRTSQLQLLWDQWLGHRLGLLWCWMVCLGNKLRSFCHFWNCTQVLHFRLFIDCEGYSISSKGFLPTVDIMVIRIKLTYFHPLIPWFLRCWCSLLLSPTWPWPTYLDSRT